MFQNKFVVTTSVVQTAVEDYQIVVTINRRFAGRRSTFGVRAFGKIATTVEKPVCAG